VSSPDRPLRAGGRLERVLRAGLFAVTAELGPPASGPTPEIPRPRPTIVPNTFLFMSFSQ